MTDTTTVTSTTATDKTAATTDATKTAAAATAAATDTTKTTTVLDTAKDATAATDKTATATQQSWPDDWRTRIAGGDEKTAKRLERFLTPDAMWKSYTAMESKLGEMKPVLAKDATPEQVTAWRKDNGIPDKAEGYLENLPDGVVIGEQDKPLVALFAKDMHDKNASPDIVHTALQSYYKVQDHVNTQMAERDATDATETEESLRLDLGGNYRREIQGLENYLSTLPKEVSEPLRNARLGNGKPMFGDANAVKWFMSVVRELNPASTVVPGAGAEANKSIQAELDSIAKQRKENPDAYYKDAKLLARERELIDAQIAVKARA